LISDGDELPEIGKITHLFQKLVDVKENMSDSSADKVDFRNTLYFFDFAKLQISSKLSRI
jgi:hypothetical protein